VLSPLQQITDRAEAIRDMLIIRQQRLLALEQQMQDYRQVLQQAESQANSLLAVQGAPGAVTRQAVWWGLLAAALLIALAYTLATIVRWTKELRAFS
jgi:hypothetical protein